MKYRGRTVRGLAASTREGYAQAMRVYVVRYFRGRRLGEIGRADVKAFVDHLAAQAPRCPQRGASRLAPATIRRIVTPLKALLAEAYELELLASDAAGPAPPPTLSREQIETLLEHLDPRDRLLVLVLCWTGLRIAEALGLRWEDLGESEDGPVRWVRRQWQDGRLVDGAKTSAGLRAVAVVPSLARELAQARVIAEFGAGGDPIFATARGTHQDSLRTAAADQRPGDGERRQRTAQHVGPAPLLVD